MNPAGSKYQTSSYCCRVYARWMGNFGHASNDPYRSRSHPNKTSPHLHSKFARNVLMIRVRARGSVGIGGGDWKWRRPAPMRLHASGPGECKQEAPRWLLYFTRDVFWHWLRVNACDDRLRGTILQSPDSNTDFFYSSRILRCHFWTSCSNETHANWMPVYSRWIFLSYDFFAHLFLCEFLDEVFEKIFKVVY